MYARRSASSATAIISRAASRHSWSRPPTRLANGVVGQLARSLSAVGAIVQYLQHQAYSSPPGATGDRISSGSGGYAALFSQPLIHNIWV